MKIYLATSEISTRIFETEDSLIKFIINFGKLKNTSNLNIKIFDVANIEEINADEYLKSFNKSISIENKLTEVLNEDSDWVSKVINFKRIFNEQAPESKSKTEFNDLMLSISINKEPFKKLIKDNSVYLIYSSASSVEWYKSLLDIYNFRKIENNYLGKIYNKNGNFFRYQNMATPLYKKENFLKAKSIK